MDHRLYTVLSSSDETWCNMKGSFPFSFTDSVFKEPVNNEEIPVSDPQESASINSFAMDRQTLFP